MKRQSPLLFFPPHILNDVNKEIDAGWGCSHIWHVLDSKWKNELKRVPCKITIDRYIKWYLNDKNKDEEDEKLAIVDLQSGSKEIQVNLEKVVDPTIPLSNKKELLEMLVRKCIQRIKTLERWQKTRIQRQKRL